ncbi:hypothetical protein EsH8_I_001303 [Colletotrichum jinshuiense]
MPHCSSNRSDTTDRGVLPSHRPFATCLVVNLASWFLFGVIGSSYSKLPEEGAELFGILLSFLYIPTLYGLVSEGVEVWPRSAHRYAHGGLLGLTLTLAYCVVSDMWSGFLQRFWFVMSGLYLGVALEMSTGYFGKFDQMLVDSMLGEFPEES